MIFKDTFFFCEFYKNQQIIQVLLSIFVKKIEILYKYLTFRLRFDFAIAKYKMKPMFALTGVCLDWIFFYGVSIILKRRQNIIIHTAVC